jgi:ankyrin repeat protein
MKGAVKERPATERAAYPKPTSAPGEDYLAVLPAIFLFKDLHMINVRPEWYQLRNAVYRAGFDVAEALLRDDPNLIDERNGIGETVLHFLAVEDFLPGIEWLHARGGSLHTSNKWGTPLLFEVAQLGYRDLFLWLVAHGADLRQRDQAGRSVWDFLAESDKQDMIGFINSYFLQEAG